MKISLNWLTDYVDVSMPAKDLAALLMRIGLGVESIEETDSDIVLDVEVTSNRPDCLGHIGVAREVAAATGRPLKLPDLSAVPMVADDLHATAGVQVLDWAFCPRYTARLLRGVKVGPSPAWLAERLEAVGMRSISNVVDATNYVMLEYSQPLHAFDFAKLHGGRIIVRRAADGETLVSIDGTKCELRDWMGIIADGDRPVAVAGVMGGLDTEVSDATTDVLIEAARFDPLTTRRTSRELNLLSESSYRFERGVDPVMLERASLRCCELILQTSPGARLLAGVCDAQAEPFRPVQVSMRPARCDKLLGIEVPRAKQVAVLGSLGLAPTDEGEAITCTIPSHRPDLYREIDLIEEVGRIHGYDLLPTAGKVSHEVHAPARTEAARKAVGDVLTAAGYFEAITFTFLDAAEAELFGWQGSLAVDARHRKTNNLLRQGLLPSLLRVRKTNQDAGVEDVRLFELAAVFPPGEASGLPNEHVQVALVSDGGLQEVRGVVEAVVARFDPSARLEVRPAEVKGFTAGAAAELLLHAGSAEARPFGVMGVVGPQAAEFYGLTAAPAGAMIRFDLLLALGQQVRKYAALPRYPAIERDLSVVVDEALAWQALSASAMAAAGPLCERLTYVGAYRGKQVGAGRKSVTVRLTFRHGDRTLRHEEVDQAMAAVVAALQQRHGAELRA